MPVQVTIFNEFRHEKNHERVRAIYPEGIQVTIANFLKHDPAFEVRTATLDEPSHGLTDEVIANTDVMFWWGHGHHAEVADEVADKVHKRVLAGMGFICLHSAHFAKPFIRLMGTTPNLKWRDNPSNREILWVTCPGHEILAGIDDHFILEQEEMYGEYFDVPTPDELLTISSFSGGEVFRSMMTWRRGAGRVFYFRPGHESFPTFHDANVQRILTNAVHWAAPRPGGKVPPKCPNPKVGWLDKA